MTESWKLPPVKHLLDEVCAKYRVDPDRISLVGLSMGGDMAWLLAENEPDRFAALLPMAGEGDGSAAGRIKDLPTWVFEGQEDNIVSPTQVSGMVDALRQAGGRPHFTFYPDTGHQVWFRAFATEPVIPWLLAQKRGQPEVSVPGTAGP